MTSPTFTLGGAAPLRPEASSEEILRGPTFTLGALHPETPLVEKLSFPKKMQLTLSKCV